MKRILPFLLCGLPLWCQSVSFGVKAGVPLGDALSAAEGTASTQSIGTQRWTAGVTVELNLPASVSIGVDALYRRFSYSSFSNFVVTSFTNSNTGHWEFPVYAKYRFGKGPVRPYVEAGFAFDRASTSGTTGCTGGEVPAGSLCGSVPASSTFSSSQWGAGVLVGGGVEIKVPFVKIAPEVRYTRWEKGVFSQVPEALDASSQPNQAEVLLGIRF
jgi:hypothetical protein